MNDQENNKLIINLIDKKFTTVKADYFYTKIQFLLTLEEIRLNDEYFVGELGTYWDKPSKILELEDIKKEFGLLEEEYKLWSGVLDYFVNQSKVGGSAVQEAMPASLS